MLCCKQAEIQATIAANEAKAEGARAIVSAADATIRVFDFNAFADGVMVYTDLHRLFEWGEMAKQTNGRRGQGERDVLLSFAPTFPTASNVSASSGKRTSSPSRYPGPRYRNACGSRPLASAPPRRPETRGQRSCTN